MKQRLQVHLGKIPAEEKSDDDERDGEADAYRQEGTHGAHGDLPEKKRAGPQREREGYQYLALLLIHLYL